VLLLLSANRIGCTARQVFESVFLQVLLGVRQAEVKDYEIMHSWRQLAPGRLAGRQRSCLYLQPQERLYFAAAGRAVAVYDYDVTATRVAAPADAPVGAVACVATPKGISQCI
jgi:hypothetical protein